MAIYWRISFTSIFLTFLIWIKISHWYKHVHIFVSVYTYVDICWLYNYCPNNYCNYNSSFSENTIMNTVHRYIYTWRECVIVAKYTYIFQSTCLPISYFLLRTACFGSLLISRLCFYVYYIYKYVDIYYKL